MQSVTFPATPAVEAATAVWSSLQCAAATREQTPPVAQAKPGAHSTSLAHVVSQAVVLAQVKLPAHVIA
jgi:hypothetical protein